MVISNIKVLEGPPIDDLTLTSSKCEHFLPAVLRSVFFLTEFYYMIPILFSFFLKMIEVKKNNRGEWGRHQYAAFNCEQNPYLIPN